MQLRKNRRVELAAINAARQFFEQNDCVYQTVDLGNDYGKDAYVDLTVDRRVQGLCIAVQVKGGLSYKRSEGYAIPVEGHFDVWRSSSIPIAGLVHDPEDGLIRWCSITAYLESLAGEKPSIIPVPAQNMLTADTLASHFRPFFEREARRTAAGNCILEVCSETSERRIAAILDCLAHGRTDPRPLVALRYLFSMFDDQSLLLATFVLTHVTDHPDIFWTKKNWIPQDIRNAVCKHFRWSSEEVVRLLTVIAANGGYYRGGVGQHAYSLLVKDNKCSEKVEECIGLTITRGQLDEAWFAVYFTVYWAGGRAIEKLSQLVERDPRIQSLELFQDLSEVLARDGRLSLS